MPENYEKLQEDKESISSNAATSDASSTPSDAVEIVIDPIPVKPKKFSIKLNIMAVLLLIAANYLYINCDKKCPYGNETECAVLFIKPQFKRWGLELGIAAFVFTLINHLAIRRSLPRAWLILANLNLLYLLAFYDPVLNAFEYGLVIALFLVVFMLLWIIVFGVIVFMMKCWKKSKLLFTGLLLLVLCPGASFYFTRLRNSCGDWTKGLGGEEIMYNGGTCSVEIPQTCIYEVTSGLLDLYSYGSCPSSETEQAIFDKYFSGASVIGYPRTEKFPTEDRLASQENILKRMVPLKDMNDPAGKDLEVFVDMTVKGDPKLKIEIKKNQTLIEERAKINSDSLANNVLVVYIDTLSRVNAHRKLKKTMAWFEKYMNQQDADAETFQFFKYHAVAPHTYENLIESFYGVHKNDPSLFSASPPSSTIKEFQDSGYITGHSSDLCQIKPLEFNIPPVQDVPYDHEGLSMACDPNFFIPGNGIGLDHGPYSSLRRCLYKRDVYEYIYDYGSKFWTTYKDQKKFLYLEFLDAHEFTGEHVRHMDNTLATFLETLQNDGLLKNTAVILYSDHGNHINIPFELAGFRQVEIEKYLPALFMKLPKEINDKYRSDLKVNQQSMMSPHQLHNFFLTLAHGEKSPLLADSLIGRVTKQRTCEDIRVEGECMCPAN